MVRGPGSLQMATLRVAVLTRPELLGCPSPPRADSDCFNDAVLGRVFSISSTSERVSF